MMIVAKMIDGRIVQIVRVAESVNFSDQRGWVLVCYDFEQVSRKRQEFRWFPATTQFQWARDFIGV